MHPPAQSGGLGLIVYNRKEGRALGEVTKFLVYNARKRQPGGDQAATYFARTECVAGRAGRALPTAHARRVALAGCGPDRPPGLDVKPQARCAHRAAGIEIVERVPIPDELVPPDAQVEIEAKKAAGYFTPDAVVDDLACVVGRDLKDY
jgi:hypothetical protein